MLQKNKGNRSEFHSERNYYLQNWYFSTKIFLQEPKDPLENLCKILDRLAKLNDENKCLRTRVDFLERQDALQKIIINSTFATKYKEIPKDEWEDRLDDHYPASSRV